MGIESWSTSAGSNNQAPPNGWPAGMLPSQVEPTGRQMMASLASWYQAAEWINYNYPIVYGSATIFTISTNVTTLFHVGRRVQATDGSTSVYGTITSSAFTTLTTVTVTWDSGVLQTGVTIVYIGAVSAIHTSAPTQALTSAAFANPSASVGVAAVNGSAITAMRSDAAPAISQAIAPTWTGQHIFKGNPLVDLPASSAGYGILELDDQTGARKFQAVFIGSTAASVYGATAGNVVLDTASGASLTLSTADTARLAIGTSGNVSINAPSSGTALTVNNLAGNTFGIVLSGSRSNNNYYSATNGTETFFAGVESANVGWSGTLSATEYDLGTNGTARVTIGATGNVNINAPSSGDSLTIAGLANNNTLTVVSSSTASQGFGVFIRAGTNSSDYSLDVQNAAATLTYFKVRGDGVVFGNDGTSLFELGYKDVPQNVQSTNYQFALSDRGKGVYTLTSGITFTIPANASVAFPIGSVIVVTNDSGGNISIAITTDTLAWMQGGASSGGTRTVALASIVTLQKVGATRWTISGNGIS
jgi:hypothetical protein